MFNISSFLERFSKKIKSEELYIQKISDVISEQTGVLIPASSVEIRNAVVYIQSSPAVKNAVFMKKRDILDKLSGIPNYNINIVDIR